METQQSFPAWLSRVRGLMLGLALGDSSTDAHKSDFSARRRAGAATELAAWTVEGLLRDFTASNWAILPDSEGARGAYQRWAMLRGGHSDDPLWNPTPDLGGTVAEGWLLGTPEVQIAHGSSPSMMRVAMTGAPTPEPSARGLIKALPYAVLAGAGEFSVAGSDKIASYAGMFTGQTHAHPQVTGGTIVVTHLLSDLLKSTCTLRTALEVFRDRSEPLMAYSASAGFPLDDVVESVTLGLRHPRETARMRQLSAGDDALSALSAGLYVAASFSSFEEAGEALGFCGTGKGSKSAAAVAMAAIGAAHGAEALPAPDVDRLEFGWVMDRLAVDLGVMVANSKAQPSADPGWRIKYPAERREL